MWRKVVRGLCMVRMWRQAVRGGQVVPATVVARMWLLPIVWGQFLFRIAAPVL